MHVVLHLIMTKDKSPKKAGEYCSVVGCNNMATHQVSFMGDPAYVCDEHFSGN